jgi:hypothetical protein
VNPQEFLADLRGHLLNRGPPAPYPLDSRTGFGTQPNCQLRDAVLKVAEVSDLEFYRWYYVLLPAEAIGWRPQIQVIDAGVDHGVTDSPVFEDLSPRVRFRNQRQGAIGVRGPGIAVGVLYVRLVLFPGPEGLFIGLKIHVCEIERVIRNLPAGVCVFIAKPHFFGTLFDAFSQHGQGRMVLTLEGVLKDLIRVHWR